LCVVFRHLGKAIELKFNSLHETVFRGITDRKIIHQADVQKDIIERLISRSNIISLSDIDKIETCKYLLPEEIRKRVSFNPTHYFLARFSDGSFENFRASETGFYEVPFNNKLENIVEIFNSTLILKNGDTVELKNYMDWKNNEANFKKIHLASLSLHVILEVIMKKILKKSWLKPELIFDHDIDNNNFPNFTS
jgi:DNA primase catalytic subunit